jgi:hydroxymethylcytosylglucuronate/cytosylglucuronate synthase
MTPAGMPARPPAIAFCGVDFGWGSAGKLSAILRALTRRDPTIRLVGLGTGLGRPLLDQIRTEAWYEEFPRHDGELRGLTQRHGMAAAVVVLDPEVADALTRAGCPAVFVDSLPFLWTDNDPLPRDAAAYCAQLCLLLPRHSWGPLRRIERLHWTEGITVPARPGDRETETGLAVLNFGGLHSPLQAAGDDAYLDLVLTPALRALAQAGMRRIEVCGNVAGLGTGPASATVAPAQVAAHPRAHAEFLGLLDRAEILVTSPGLTTLLEASARSVPVVCLPPQNLSQFHNAEVFAALADQVCRVAWPEEVLRVAAVQGVRQHGEMAAIELIYGALRRAAERAPQVWAALRAPLAAAITAARQLGRWNGLAEQIGQGGAEQIAEIVLDLVGSQAPGRAGSGRQR